MEEERENPTLGWVFEHSNTTVYDRLVLLALAYNAGPSGAVEVYGEGKMPPGPRTRISQIARQAGLSRDETAAALNRLVATGAIVFRSRTPDGMGTLYSIVTDRRRRY